MLYEVITIKEDKDRVESLKAQTEEGSVDISDREKIYDEIDKLEKEIDEKLEAVLNEILV